MMTVKLTRHNGPIWGGTFRCPIDKRKTYVKAGDTLAHFGAAEAFGKQGKKAIAATINWEKMIVTENKD